MGAFAPVTEHVFVRLELFLKVLVEVNSSILLSISLATAGETGAVKTAELLSSKEDTAGLTSACLIGTDTDARRCSTNEAVDNFLHVWPLLSPSKVFCCVIPQERRNRSETSVATALMSDDELHESSWDEFFLERGSGADSQGQTSSEVETPATTAILGGFFTLHADSGSVPPYSSLTSALPQVIYQRAEHPTKMLGPGVQPE